MKIKIGLDLDGVLTYVGYPRHTMLRNISVDKFRKIEDITSFCPLSCSFLRSTIDALKNDGNEVSIILISTWCNAWHLEYDLYLEEILDTKIEGLLTKKSCYTDDDTLHHKNFIEEDMDDTSNYSRRFNNLIKYLNTHNDYDLCIVIDDNQVIFNQELADQHNIVQWGMKNYEKPHWVKRDIFYESGFNKIDKNIILENFKLYKMSL